jgi:carbon-monoxide dehydrogenase medium subunit
MFFDYLEAKNTRDAIGLLSEHSGKTMVIAGGTDLVPQIRSGKKKPHYIIAIDNVPGLDNIEYREKVGLSIGALTTVRFLETSSEIKKRYPLISQAARELGSVAIRNVATLGGNLCNASPSAEMAPALIGLRATVKIGGHGGERVVLLEEFFTGPGQTVLKSDEILLGIEVPVLQPNTKGVYLKHSMRGSIDLSVVGVAAVLTTEGELCMDAKIVLGAVAPTPLRAKEAEKMIRGKRVGFDLIQKAAKAASREARPISDIRASAEYRSKMVAVLTRRALIEAS